MTVNSATTPGQILTSAYVNNMPRGVISSVYDLSAAINNNLTTVQAFLQGPAFTPVAGRQYRLSWSIGAFFKHTNAGNIDFELRKDSTTGTILDGALISGMPVIQISSISKVTYLTTTQMGTALFTPTLCVTANTAGCAVSNTVYPGSIIFEDMGAV